MVEKGIEKTGETNGAYLRELVSDLRRGLDSLALSLQSEILKLHSGANIYYSGEAQGIAALEAGKAIDQINQYFGTKYESDVGTIYTNLGPLMKLE